MDGADYQILLEADFLANACENGYPRERVEAFLDRAVRTAAGERLIRSVLQV